MTHELAENDPRLGYEGILREGEWPVTVSPLLSLTPGTTESAANTLKRLRDQEVYSSVRVVPARNKAGRIRPLDRAILVAR